MARNKCIIIIIVNVLKWGFSNEQETCDCGIRQTMHATPTGLPHDDTVCSPQDLPTANGIAIGSAGIGGGGARFEGHDSWWKDKNDDVNRF